MILTFVTGNAGKLTEARRVFAGTGIEIRGCRADFDEPRSADPAAIAGKKLAQARGLIPPPYFVQDAAFSIDALGGFPATYVNFALGTIGVEGILKLMEGVRDRRCRFRQCVACFDGEREVYFTSETPGTLAPAARGGDRPEHLSALSRVFIPEGAACTLAELSPERLFAFYEEDGRTLRQLREFLEVEE